MSAGNYPTELFYKDIEKHLAHLKNGDLMWISKRIGRGLHSIAGTTDYGKSDKNLPSRKVRYNGKYARSTHIIFYLHYGVVVKKGEMIDHLDGNPLNNKIENLRLTDYKGNNRNKLMQRNNTTGVTGVVLSGNGYKAKIGKESLGNYKTIFEAACARRSAENKHGYTDRHGMKKRHQTT